MYKTLNSNNETPAGKIVWNKNFNASEAKNGNKFTNGLLK